MDRIHSLYPEYPVHLVHPCSKIPYRIEPLVEATAMRPFPVDPSGGDGQGCARLCAGGTPALPGSRHPMTSSHSGHEIAEAFWFRLSLKEVHLSSCLFVFIRVHSWFVFINDRLFFLERSARQGGGPACLKQNLFHSRMIRPVVGGGGRTCLKSTGPPQGGSDSRGDIFFPCLSV